MINNILCVKNKTLPISILTGWKNAFQEAGYNFDFWNNDTQTVFDAFSNTFPDVFIFSSDTITRGVVTCLKDNPNLRGILLVARPALEAGESSLWEDLMKDTGQPKFFITPDPSLSSILNSFGISNLNILPAADTTVYYPRPFQKKWSSTLSVVLSGNPDEIQYILPFCETDYPHPIRIFSRENLDLNIPNYVGRVRDENIPNIYSSSDITIDTSGGIDCYNILACKGFCITNGKDCLLDIPVFENLGQLNAIIEYYVKEPAKRKIVSDINEIEVIKNHTYRDRIKEIILKLEKI